ncbi:MAG: sigma-54-dependent Fis family transcriptional regulator [bacterium]|nr:sigma-54-dependent Fis family transcriptional regulator [bacterium]
MSNALAVLAVDDEREPLLVSEVALRFAGIRDVICCEDSRKVLGILASRSIGAVLLDIWMPHISGEELLQQIRQEYPEIPVIILTGANDADTAVRCMTAGAFDYMVKPVEESRLVSGVRRALELRALQLENAQLRERMLSGDLNHPEAFAGIVTSDPRMRTVLQYVETAATTGKPILITGETGVGKELIAKAVHSVSGLQGPFVAVNVAGVDDSVFSDTLFGHVRGAFTGANGARPGLIERAAGGTLFLDEIGDLSNASQVKLLRLLQEGEYMPLGSDTARRSEARVIVATNRDLAVLQEEGAFRKDLYYRLQTHHVAIPPLRERLGDVPLLVDRLLGIAATTLGKKKPTQPPELAVLLSAYHFPGNIRELEAMVFEAVSRHTGGVLSTGVFRDRLGEDTRRGPVQGDDPEDSLLMMGDRFPTLREAGEALVDEAMRRAKSNQTVAARLLGISRPALNKRLRNREKGDSSG